MNNSRGRGWAYFGFYFGIINSISANVADMVLRPGATISITIRVIIGIVVPMFALVGVEIFQRVPWRPNVWHWLVRLLGVLPVAGIAAYGSWGHQRGLLLLAGEAPHMAFWIPLTVDGTMLLAAVALALTGRQRPQLDGNPQQPSIAARLASTLVDGMAAGRTVADAARSLRTDAPSATAATVARRPDHPTFCPDRPTRTRRGWTPEQLAQAEHLLKDTIDTDTQVATAVFGTPAARKRVARLRDDLRKEPTVPLDLPEE